MYLRCEELRSFPHYAIRAILVRPQWARKSTDNATTRTKQDVRRTAYTALDPYEFSANIRFDSLTDRPLNPPENESWEAYYEPS